MATTAKARESATREVRRRTTPQRGHESARKRDAATTRDRASLDHLQRAISEIDRARGEATTELRRRLDGALDRLRDAAGQIRGRTEDQLGEWEDALEHAGEDLRRELARRAIRAQRDPEALRELSAEIRRRKAELAPKAPAGDGRAS